MIVSGFDEVGRGAWAGPLTVVGVSLASEEFAGLRDSKYYSGKKRQKIYGRIMRTAQAISICWISNSEIDTNGLGPSLSKAFKGCATNLPSSTVRIVDGSVNYLNDFVNSFSEPKADDTYPAVAAASIVAKHLRDSYMQSVHNIFPDYLFMSNVGYGTKDHKAALSKIGPCRLHRLSFKGVR